MRTEKAEIVDFLKADQRTTVIRLIPLLLQGGQSGLNRLSQIAAFRKLIFENQDDIEYLESSYLVWYKPNNRGEADWNRAGCENYTVAEYVDSILKGDVSRGDIKNLVRSLKGGLNEDIVLALAFDTKLNKRVIVDGCKRAVALALIARQSREEFLKLLNSGFPVVMMEPRSRLAHCLYPCDFLDFCAKTEF